MLTSKIDVAGAQGNAGLARAGLNRGDAGAKGFAKAYAGNINAVTYQAQCTISMLDVSPTDKTFLEESLHQDFIDIAGGFPSVEQSSVMQFHWNKICIRSTDDEKLTSERAARARVLTMQAAAADL